MDKSSAAFMSYVRFDDKHNGGQLTNFRKLLSGEVRALIGRKFDIFQDTSDIATGQDWKERIGAGIDACALFMPIITPSFFNSPACRQELARFIAREWELGRNDLILPIYYITCPLLEGYPGPEVDFLADVISARNYFDLRNLRGEPPSLRLFRKKLTELAMQVVEGLERNRARLRPCIFTREALTSSAHGTAGLAAVAGAPGKSAIAPHPDSGRGGDDQAAAELRVLLRQMRYSFIAVEPAP